MPILKGGVCLFFSFLILPGLVSSGYQYRLWRAAALGDEQPEFEEYGDLLGKGLVLIVAGLPLGVLFLLGYVLLFTENYVAAIAVNTVVFALAPAITTVFAATGSISETYTSRRVPDFVLTGHYAKYLVLSLGLAVAMYIVMLLSVFVFLVGVFFGTTYATFAQASYWGRVYNQAMEKGVVEPVERPVHERYEQTAGY